MTSGYVKKTENPTIHGLVRSSTSRRRRQLARRRARVRSGTAGAEAPTVSATTPLFIRSGSRHAASAARLLDLSVELRRELLQPALQVLDLPRLPLLEEVLDRVGVRLARRHDRRRARLRVREDVQ